MGTYTATATIDLDAISANLERIGVLARGAQVMAVVKADAYGHGLIPVARAALAGGATWLGTAQLAEALALRAAGIEAPILAWLFTPGEDLIADCVANRIDLSASDVWALEEIAAAGALLGRCPRVHLEVDTGMSRGGVQLPQFAAVAAAAARAHADGSLDVVGIWTHLACADQPGHPSIAAQYAGFETAIAMLTGAGVVPRIRHIANSAATVTGLDTYDLVRAGLICYGLSPVEATPAELGLRPALRLVAGLANVKPVTAGSGISYGHTAVTHADTRIGVVALGYGDGIPRQASNAAEVTINGRRRRIAGRVCMDQFMVDLGDLEAAPGTEVVLLGDAARGEVTAAEWAEAAGTINYEIVTRLGARIPRRYLRRTTVNIPLPDADATIDLGRRIADLLQPGDLVVLTGGLGAGKTTLTKGIGEGLGVEGTVASPTFIIARSHPGELPLVHVDAYRLGGLDELDDLDLDSAFEESVTVVEWGAGLVEDLSEDRLEIEIDRPRGQDTRGRSATVTGVGARWRDVDLRTLGTA